jgi:hypothetical protein
MIAFIDEHRALYVVVLRQALAFRSLSVEDRPLFRPSLSEAVVLLTASICRRPVPGRTSQMGGFPPFRFWGDNARKRTSSPLPLSTRSGSCARDLILA